MMRKLSILLFIATICTFSGVQAQIYEGKTLAKATITDAVAGVNSGSIVILGESHGLPAHQNQHVEVLTALREQGLKVSVGLEFLNYPDQGIVDQYVRGQLSEADFLLQSGWQAGISFDFYRKQLLFPEFAKGEFSIALNLPRTISSKISRGGLASLTPAEASLLPPNFAVGRESYKQRFAAAAGAHCPNLDRCFTAQSAWDDTMAWQAVNFINEHPEQVLVIVVGEFHAQFGGGLAWRIQQRNAQVAIRTISQIWAEELTDAELHAELQPSLVEGPRADFIWVSGK